MPTYLPQDVYDVESRAESVAVADVNGDGHDDVILTTSYSGNPENDFSLIVFPQSPSGALGPFTRYETPGSEDDPMAVAAGDLDGDRYADVAVATLMGVEVRYGGPDGLGSEVYVTSEPAHHVEIADMDGMSPAEIVTSGGDGVTVYWWMAEYGYWRPMPVHPTVATEVEVGDVTGDGRPDIVGFQSHTVYVSAQLYGSAFAEPVRCEGAFEAYWPDGGGRAVGDINAGRTDVALSTPGYASGAIINLFGQTEAGELGPPSVYPAYGGPQALEAADLDGDGRDELAMAHGGAMRAGVWWSEGAQTLYEVPEADYRPTALALGDVNSDGVGDLVLADPANGLVVLRSSVPATDTDPPETMIGSGPWGSIPDNGVTFSFSADEPSSFACSFAGSTFSPCTSPSSYVGLGDGTYQFQMKAPTWPGTPIPRRPLGHSRSTPGLPTPGSSPGPRALSPRPASASRSAPTSPTAPSSAP